MPSIPIWTQEATAPVSSISSNQTCADPFGNVYALIGGNPNGSLYKWTASTNSWAAVGASNVLPVDYYGSLCSDSSGNIYTLGGESNGTYITTIYQYAPSTGVLQDFSGTPISLYGGGAVRDSAGNIFLFGGNNTGYIVALMYK